MDLSVVIVSYNVRYFLEQCLQSVARASAGLAVETWVVDNASADDSVAMVRSRFPEVHLIANPDNPGFSVANNQAIRRSRGRYVLLLNPDTVLREDTLRSCMTFADKHADLGGLGVRMIDGSGRFLPESKRGLPTPRVAFGKAFGLARLFPRSRRFNHYHLGYLDADENHPVEILAGAFLWLRRGALDRVGLLDEAFFMYGEDIDLSYRLLQGGYQNYYLAETGIIHYKGESTKRGSLNYVRVFYRAMIIFVRKHFAGTRARLFIGLLQVAIYLRAAFTVVANLWRRLRFPLFDAVGIYVGLLVLKRLWAAYHFGDPDYFPDRIDYLHFPAYTLLWTGSLFLGGGYDRPYAAGRLLRSLGVGTLLLLAVYGLLPEELRPSRALLVLGAAWATVWTLVVHRSLNFSGSAIPRLLVVGGAAETERTLRLLQRAGANRNFLDRVGPDRQARLPSLACRYRADELIFCSADLSFAAIQDWMIELGPRYQFRIVPEASDSIIGSHRPDQRGVLYTIDVNLRLSDPVSRRAKWIFDRTLALLLLLGWPLLCWPVRNRLGLLANAWRVLIGRRTWVGYHPANANRDRLPQLRPGVVTAGGRAAEDPATLRQLDLLYARDYTVGHDLRTVYEQRAWLGG